MEDNVTVTHRQDDITGLSSLVVTDMKQRGLSSKDMRPAIKINNKSGVNQNIPGRMCQLITFTTKRDCYRF